MRLGQPNQQRPASILRALMRRGRPVIMPGCFNALSARVLEEAGFDAIYMSGYGTSLSMVGLPDAGLATLTEMALNARYISNAVGVPVVADADTGFGNAINVVRTVEEYIRAGVSGVQLEDQVAPKRCGHVAGREVIDRTEAVLKIRAACRTRTALDPDVIIVARTDARGAHGGTLDEAIWRANAFIDAGADLAFVEGPASRGEVERVCREVNGPIFYNMTGISPRYSDQELADLGIAVCIMAGAPMRAAIMAMYDFACAVRERGTLAEADLDARFKQHPLGDMHGFAGFNQIRDLEGAFLPESAAEKYADSLGYQPTSR